MALEAAGQIFFIDGVEEVIGSHLRSVAMRSVRTPRGDQQSVSDPSRRDFRTKANCGMRDSEKLVKKIKVSFT